MFTYPTASGARSMKTWNIWVGCRFNCQYCNARKMALARLQHVPRYRKGFEPHFVEEELDRHFAKGQWVFVGYMGDISFASDTQRERLMSCVRDRPHNTFLFCSKSPACYLNLNLEGTPNLVLGTTIETNRDTSAWSQAPPTFERAEALARLSNQRKFISIEPIMDFDLADLVHLVDMVNPELIEIGADNYCNSLPEPPRWKLKALLNCLRQIVPHVIEKEGLERLLQMLW
jgi:DNA repair photolyase